MKEWGELEAGTGHCAGCQRLLVDGEPCWSTLVARDDPAASGRLPSDEDDAPWLRLDFCEACREAAPVGGISRWRTVNREPVKLPKTVIDPAMAVELLERLLEDEAAERLAYLVVLLLVRRKVLRLVSARDGEMVVRRPGRRGRWRVREHRIEPAELLAMDRELATLMALEVASAEQDQNVSDAAEAVSARG